MATLNDILLDSSSYLDIDASLPTGTELATRVRFSKLAVNEWAQAYRWRQLKVDYSPSLASFASIGIPGFRFLDGPPMEFLSSGLYQEYPEIAPADRFAKASDDQYSWMTGNDQTGWALHLNGINVNATLSNIPYYRGPSGMATLTDVCEVPDAQFVTDRIISYVLQSRNDERFPIVLANGNRLLRNMFSVEMVRLPGGINSTKKQGSSAYSIGS